jgi:hypothetical protein
VIPVDVFLSKSAISVNVFEKIRWFQSTFFYQSRRFQATISWLRASSQCLNLSGSSNGNMFVWHSQVKSATNFFVKLRMIETEERLYAQKNWNAHFFRLLHLAAETQKLISPSLSFFHLWRRKMNFGIGVARWFLFKPKIQIWVNFGVPQIGKCWYILWPSVIFHRL